MTRLLYRCLIRLHPSAFRNRHGDEMLCDFDESPAVIHGPLLIDALGSLARQWLLHSALWRWCAGAALSASLLASIVQPGANQQGRPALRGNLQERPRTPLNRPEFNREASEAVAMLARFREDDRKKSRLSHSSAPQPAASEQTSQD